MATILTTKKDVEILRECGRRLARVLDQVERAVKPGVMTKSLDELALRLIREGGDEPAFLNYKPYGAAYPFPASLCVSVNDEIVHGIPGERTLEEGDIVGIDLGITHKGLITDSARTVPVGHIDNEVKKLLEVTKGTLMAGIKAIRAGGHINDIGKAIEKHARPFGYGIVEELGGHGVGKKVHELPYVPNFDMGKKGEKLKSGMVLAIEPMLTMGKRHIKYEKDGYTISTRDHSRAAHFEHTILVTEKGAEVITQ